tara:strand:+ start:154 stop:810 length:657 start_codon:yes stop_codon:yes gene_type:complete
MKRIIIPLLFTIVSYSQNDVQNVRVIKDDSQVAELVNMLGKNEIKLDVIDLLFQPALSLSYERISDSYSSFGGDVFINFNNNNSSVSWSDRFTISPFYRFYFLNKQDFGGAGFFVELFSKFSFGQETVEYAYGIYDELTDPYYEFVDENYFDIGIGVGLGRKWINKKGITFEIMFGIGRYLLDEVGGVDDMPYGVDDVFRDHRPELTIKGGISIGKRF